MHYDAIMFPGQRANTIYLSLIHIGIIYHLYFIYFSVIRFQFSTSTNTHDASSMGVYSCRYSLQQTQAFKTVNAKNADHLEMFCTFR